MFGEGDENLKTFQILIVEDDSQVRQQLARHLNQQMDWDCFQVGDGQRALEYLQRVWPHVVILDISLPGISGLEVLEHIRKHSATLPVIVMSRWDSTTVAKTVESANGIYVPKPLSYKVLLDVIKVLLPE